MQLPLFAPPAPPADDPLPGWCSVWRRVDCPRRDLYGMIVRSTSYRRDVREWQLSVEAADGTTAQVRAVDCRPHDPQATKGETP